MSQAEWETRYNDAMRRAIQHPTPENLQAVHEVEHAAWMDNASVGHYAASTMTRSEEAIILKATSLQPVEPDQTELAEA